MDPLKKCCQCFCFSQAACGIAQCVDMWHACQSCGMANLYYCACCWTLFSPLCLDCKLGDSSKACENCSKCGKYCLFSCALYFASCVDGIYNCVQIIKQTCGGEEGGVKTFTDLTKHTEYAANKVKQSLGIETGVEPIRSYSTFTP